MGDPDPAACAEGEETDLRDSADREPAPVVHELVVAADGNGMRLDKYLATRLPAVSRSRIQKWIEDDAVHLNGQAGRVRSSVFAHDRIRVCERPALETTAYRPEAMPIPIVYEDQSIIVIDKPAGLVVHPGAGNWSGTLLNGLLAYDPLLAGVPRAGIVHRLDAGTSGLMVVARTVAAHLDLVRQLQMRSVAREYWAVVAGAVAPALTIDGALARDPRNPLRFRVSTAPSAKAARTYVRRLAQWKAGSAAVSWVACRLETGRTHQIRVHLESIGHPLLGDPLYRLHMPATLAATRWLERQALHACRLELLHPLRRQAQAWASAPPADLHALMRRLGAREEQLRPPRAMTIDVAPRVDAGAPAGEDFGDDSAG